MIEAVEHLEGFQNKLTELSSYNEIYKTLNAIKVENPELNFGTKLLRRLGNEGVVSTAQDKERILYSLYSIALYQLCYKELKKHYYTVKEVLLELCFSKKSQNLYQYSYDQKFYSLHNNGHMNMVLLDHKIEKNNIFILKSEVERFKNEYISWPEAANQAGITMDSFKHWMMSYSKVIIRLKNDTDYFYIYRKDWTLFLKEKKNIGYISRAQVAKALGVTEPTVDKVISIYNIAPIKRDGDNITNYFKQEDVNRLIKRQNQLWLQFRKKYFSSKEATSILGISSISLRSKNYNDKIRSFIVPPLISINRDEINFRKGGGWFIYLKKDVLVVNQQRELPRWVEKVLIDIIHQSDQVTFKTFETALKEAKISFSDKGKKTEQYWHQYVKKKITNSKATDDTKRKEIRKYITTTIKLTKMTLLQEIFDFTENEINMSVFNSTTESTVQTEMYKFLKVISKTRNNSSLPISFKFNKLKNIYKKNNKEEKKEKTIYPTKQYIDLLDFSCDIQERKLRAIEDIRKQFNGESHSNRDSSWLYVLLHLNNTWRHYDVTLFPRITLKGTAFEQMDPLDALNWIEKNDLTELETSNIINHVKSIPFKHSKTKKKRYFFCSEDLSSAFALAVVLCELRCRICQPLMDTVIDFGNNRNFKESQKKTFFEGFKHQDFNFMSKQMNRTLISYIYSIIKNLTNRNPVEITKYIRSHASEETTNIYIQIPQEQLDFISNQLFLKGHFGYAYDALCELILPEKMENMDIKNRNALLIKNVFGDAFQIEQTARYMNRLTKEQQSVRKVLEGLSLEERVELSNSIKLGLQPAKKEGYQCIFKSCRNKEIDCDKCPFSVPNFYALSQLEEDFYLQLNEYKEKFNSTDKDGEKIRLSNILYSYIHLIGVAVNKFGSETVSAFFKNGLDGVKNELAALPSSKELVTIPEIK